MTICPMCRDDNGYCYYCDKQYTPVGLHTHLKRIHKGTIREENCNAPHPGQPSVITSPAGRIPH